MKACTHSLFAVVGARLLSVALVALSIPVPGQAQASVRFETLRTMLPIEYDSEPTPVLGDLDGDGDLDLVMGGMYTSDALYLNDGSGRFTNASGQLPEQSGSTLVVVLTDIDGDRDLDIVLGRWGSRDRLYLNDGRGGFSDATARLPVVDYDQTTAIVAGDVDGDGDADLVMGKPLGENRLFLNDGTGRFVNAVGRLPWHSHNIVEYVVLALGDVDGDGDADLLEAHRDSPNFASGPSERLYLNDGRGRFTDATSQLGLPVHFDDATYALALGDVDGDGDADLVLAGDSRRYRLFVNDGLGRFRDASAQLPVAPPQHRGAFAFADVDGDGDQDLVGRNLYLNDGGGRFADASSRLPIGRAWASTVGDVDGDGDVDLVVGTTQGRLYLNDGAGYFADVTGVLPATRARAVALVDVDRDADADLIVGTAGRNRLYRNDGSGQLTDASERLPTNPEETMVVVAGDVDADGDEDLVLGNIGQNRLYLNDGKGRFTDATAQLPAVQDCTTALLIGDIDGDGDLDLVTGNAYHGRERHRIYLNDGRGRFTDAAAQLPVATGTSVALALGDVDGDGDADLCIGERSQCWLYLNDGSGHFTDATGQLPILTETLALALGDVDGDGDRDLMVGEYGPWSWAQIRVLSNDGSGRFTDGGVQLPGGRLTPNSLLLRDIDGDGHADLIAGYDTSARLYRNDGTGRFGDLTSSLHSYIGDRVRASSVDAGDMDGDGDPDLVIGYTSISPGDGELLPVQVLLNLRTQLAWRALPRIGRPLSLDLYGSGGGRWLLFASLGRAAFSLPPFGTLWLDPGTMVQMGQGGLSVAGEGSLTAQVPPDAALVGSTVYFQALLDSPLRLSNLEICTFASR